MERGVLYPQPSPEQVFARNAPYVRPGATNFNTALPPISEQLFRNWTEKNKVPFNADAPVSDYDMRGFYKALMSGDPKAQSAVDPNDGRMHYPDFWKTPYHETFSNQSQWALPSAPSWTEDDKLIAPNGRIVFDDRAK
jgi:hypothetical protein